MAIIAASRLSRALRVLRIGSVPLRETWCRDDAPLLLSGLDRRCAALAIYCRSVRQITDKKMSFYRGAVLTDLGGALSPLSAAVERQLQKTLKG
jgi:hypothetical protein